MDKCKDVSVDICHVPAVEKFKGSLGFACAIKRLSVLVCQCLKFEEQCVLLFKCAWLNSVQDLGPEFQCYTL